MAELSFTRGKRIAVVENSSVKGENGTEIFLYHSDHKCCLDCGTSCKKGKKCCDQCAIMTYHNKTDNEELEMSKLKKIMAVFNNKKIQLTEDEFDELLNESDNKNALTGSTVSKEKIVLRSGNFFVAPSNVYGKPDRIFICGRAGSGKSFWLAEYLVQFRKFFPKRRIYLISQKTSDKLLDKLIHKRIPIEDLAEAQFEADDFKECLVICDDVDVISDKRQEKNVFDLIAKILEVGRSLDTFLILTLHIAASHNQSKRILNACTHFVYFKDSATHSNNYVLENYFGFDKQELRALKNLNSRSITIIRDVPQLVLANNLLCFQNKLSDNISISKISMS
jgi:hypothetical protein